MNKFKAFLSIAFLFLFTSISFAASFGGGVGNLALLDSNGGSRVSIQDHVSEIIDLALYPYNSSMLKVRESVDRIVYKQPRVCLLGISQRKVYR